MNMWIYALKCCRCALFKFRQKAYHSTSAKVYKSLDCKLLARYHQEQSTGHASAEKEDVVMDLFKRQLKRSEYSACARSLVSASSMFEDNVFESDLMRPYYGKTRHLHQLPDMCLWDMIENGDCAGVAMVLSESGMMDSAIHLLSRY
jgi:hypothetical protein